MLAKGRNEEQAVPEALARFGEYWKYDGWFSDHHALYACHSSPLHARIIQALDAAAETTNRADFTA